MASRHVGWPAPVGTLRDELQHRTRARLGRGVAPDPPSQNLGPGETGLLGEAVEQVAVVRSEVHLNRLPDATRTGRLWHNVKY